MSLVPDGTLNLPNSGPGLKIVEEPSIKTITKRTSGLMHRKEEANMVVRQHRKKWWISHEHMFVTDVLLLSGVWGMSCYAVKHYTQQPSQLSLPSVPLSFSLQFFVSRSPLHHFCFLWSLPSLCMWLISISAHSVYLFLYRGHLHQLCLLQHRYQTLQHHGK